MNCDVALASTRKCINHLEYLLEILIDSNTLLSFKNGSHTGRDGIEVHYSSYQTFICSALSPEETRGKKMFRNIFLSLQYCLIDISEIFSTIFIVIFLPLLLNLYSFAIMWQSRWNERNVDKNNRRGWFSPTGPMLLLQVGVQATSGMIIAPEFKF